MADFNKAYAKTSKNEGGYANVPGDAGGETYAGISRVWFKNWEGWPLVDAAKPLKNNQVIHNDKIHAAVKLFYEKTFWDTIGGDLIEDQEIAERLYDFGVNAGKPKTLKQIQEILGIAQTGVLDEKTIDAINNPQNYLV